MKRENEIIVILGKKGSGKTSYALNLIRERKRLIIFDFNREYEGYTVGTPEALIEVLKLNHDSDFLIVYQPSPEREIDDHFHFLSAAIFSMSNLTFLCEEIDLVSSAGDMPEGLQRIINYGRHRGISLIGLSRRAHKVPRDLTANADRIVTFQQFEPRDIKYLADYMGERSALSVGQLKRYDKGAEFLEWTDSGTRKGKINFIDKNVEIGDNFVDLDNPAIEPGEPTKL